MNIVNKNDVLYQIKAFDLAAFRYFMQVSKLSSKAAKCLSPTQLQILDYLIQNDDKEILQRDLEEVLSLRRATVSGVLKTMEKNHLIDRISIQNDARIKKIVINDNAKKAYMEKRNEFEKLGALITKGISEYSLETFLKVLKCMQNNIENATKKRKEF